MSSIERRNLNVILIWRNCANFYASILCNSIAQRSLKQKNNNINCANRLYPPVSLVSDATFAYLHKKNIRHLLRIHLEANFKMPLSRGYLPILIYISRIMQYRIILICILSVDWSSEKKVNNKNNKYWTKYWSLIDKNVHDETQIWPYHCQWVTNRSIME